MKKIDRALIDSCTDQFRKLLEHNWSDISSMREDNDSERVRILARALINYQGEVNNVKVTISFGVRQTESSEEKINLDQLKLELDGDGEPNKPKRTRRTKELEPVE